MDIKSGKPLEGDNLNCYLKQKAIIQQYFDWSSLKSLSNEDKKYYLDGRYVHVHNVPYEISDTVKGEKGFLMRVSTPLQGNVPDLSSICGYSCVGSGDTTSNPSAGKNVIESLPIKVTKELIK